MENTSGQGQNAVVPSEIRGWNWGAFLLNWIWGVGNNTLIALFALVPFVGLVMPFVLGAKGNSWAWRNKRWESIEHFKSVQRQWTKWALIIYACLIVFICGLFFLISASMKSSEAYKLAIAKIEANSEVMQILGKPISTGMPMGSIQITPASGTAELTFNIEGPKGKGKIYLDGVKELGQWKLEQIVFEQESTGRRIDLNQ